MTGTTNIDLLQVLMPNLSHLNQVTNAHNNLYRLFFYFYVKHKLVCKYLYIFKELYCIILKNFMCETVYNML